jgi:hypothetical protein
MILPDRLILDWIGWSTGPDIIRDTHSVGIYYWWANTAEIRAHPDKEYWFWVRQRRGMLFIDIYTPSGGSVAVVRLLLLLLSLSIWLLTDIYLCLPI